MISGDIFLALRDFVKGKISANDLEEKSKIISRIEVDRNNLAQSKIHLDLGEEFGDILDINDDDSYIMSVVFSPYNDYDFYNADEIEDDMKQGYGPWPYFNEDNLKLIEKLAKYYFTIDLDLDDESKKGEFAYKLDKFFPNEYYNIASDFAMEKNNEMNRVAKDVIQNDIDDFLNEFDFKWVYPDTIICTVADLIGLYVQHNLTHVSLKKLLKEVLSSGRRNLGGWNDMKYEYQNDEDFDIESFNRTVERNLDKILSSFENETDSDTLLDYIRLVDRITKKHSIGTWYSLPKNPKILFRINGFDRDEMKINIHLKKTKGGELKNFKVSEGTFINLLYQPELFDLEL